MPVMDSLLTLPVSDYRSVDLMLRLVVALITMSALLLGFSTLCVAPRFRFPLILSSVALLGAAWFESGVWLAWKEAFELAGISYCVTGQLLAPEDRIIAWSLGVPSLLGALALLGKMRASHSGFAVERHLQIPIVLILLALLAPSSSVIALLFLGLLGWMIWRPWPENLFVRQIRTAHACVVVPFLITLLGSWQWLPLGKEAGRILVRSEVIQSCCTLVAFVAPAVILLIGVLKASNKESETAR
jgi:hypothetical protein